MFRAIPKGSKRKFIRKLIVESGKLLQGKVKIVRRCIKSMIIIIIYNNLNILTC